jgi:hypothetical protein
LFALPLVNDKERDGLLSTRIAGLNLLQLSLEHLGLDIGDEPDEPTLELPLIQSSLKSLVQACGQELKKLEEPERRTPKSKLEVIINAHKIIVGEFRDF